MKFSSTNLRTTAKRLTKQHLTPQQRDILALISAEPGLTGDEIADRLGSASGENVKVQICLMRPRLRETGLKLVNGYAVRGRS